MANGLLENAQAERLMPALRDTNLDLIGIGVEACSQSASLHDRLTTARRRAICLETRVTKVPMAHMPHQRGSRAIPSSGGTPCFGSPGNGPGARKLAAEGAPPSALRRASHQNVYENDAESGWHS